MDDYAEEIRAAFPEIDAETLEYILSNSTF